MSNKPLLGSKMSHSQLGIARYQTELNALVNVNLEVNGIYDYSTIEAITQFQRQNNLEPNGHVDPQTRLEMYRQLEILQEGRLLGNASDLPKGFLEEAKLAAALCQYVYNHDNQRTVESKFDIHPWKPIKKYEEFTMQTVCGENLLERLKMNGILGGLLSNRGKNMLHDITVRLNIDEKGYMTRNRTGFGVMLFYKEGENGISDIALVPEGSNPVLQMDPRNTTINKFINGFGDWVLSNVSQGVFNLSPQHTLVVQIAHIVDKYCNSQIPKIRLHFYGHSLGGGLATACALATNRDAITFDMAGLNKIRRFCYGYETKIKKIKNLYVAGELLSLPIWDKLDLKHNGVQFEIPNADSIDPVKAHSMTLICEFLGCKQIEKYEDE